MTTWTKDDRDEFIKSFEGFWPCRDGREQQRAEFLILIEKTVGRWPAHACIKALGQCKVTEDSNRAPTIQRIFECMREFIPRSTAGTHDGPGVEWLTFVKTHDWDAHIRRLKRQGINTAWIEAGLVRWKKGEHLLTTLTGKKYVPWGPSPTWKENRRRDREPGEEG